MRRLPLAAAVLAGTMAIVGTSCDYLAARDHLNKGVAAMKSAKYKDATEHFKQAMALDPNWDVPKLYLATAYMSQWIPGAESAENKAFEDQARAGFLKVLESSPNDKMALEYLASMSFSEATSGTPTPEGRLQKLDESAEWHNKRVTVEPNAQSLYSLGVISYLKLVPDFQAARTTLKMRPDDPGPLKDPKLRQELIAKHGAEIDGAMANLQKALDIDPEYDNAMVYMNILIRTKADTLEDKAEYDKQIAAADSWLAKSLETKKIKAARLAKKANSGIVQDAPK
ncbi:MAG: tetratricopeptide repeat protein [Acidobacteriota bacterium]